jgi:hypothetical protein
MEGTEIGRNVRHGTDLSFDWQDGRLQSPGHRPRVIKLFYFNILMLKHRSRDKALAAATAGAAAINAGPSAADGLAFAMRRCDPASGSL